MRLKIDLVLSSVISTGGGPIKQPIFILLCHFVCHLYEFIYSRINRPLSDMQQTYTFFISSLYFKFSRVWVQMKNS